MKKKIRRSVAVFLVVLFVLSVTTISVSMGATFTNSKGTITVTCGKYKKKFTAKSYGKNFSKALNAALDTARKKATAKKIAKVKVSKGNYSLDRTLKIYSNTYLTATGCYFRLYGNLLRNGYNSKVSAAYEYKGAQNITINGGTWDAMVPYSQAGTSNWRIQHSTMRFAHCNKVTIKNCSFVGNYNCHDIELGGVNNAMITKCSFTNTKPVNTFKNDGGREAIQIDVNTSDAMPEFGYFDKTTCKNISLSYCTFKNKYRAIGSHHAVVGRPFDNVKVHHNTFENIGGIAIYGIYWTNAKIYSNTMKDVGLGVDIRSMTIDGGQNFTNNDKLTYENAEKLMQDSTTFIYDNKISVRYNDNNYVRPTGIRVMGENYSEDNSKSGVKAGTYKVYNVKVGISQKGYNKPNTITGNADVAIQLNYAVNSYVKNNSIDLKGAVGENVSGIEFKACENSFIENNTIKNGSANNSKGIFFTYPANSQLPNTKVSVLNNTITNFTHYGMYLHYAEENLIKGNLVMGSQTAGIALQQSHRNLVEENTCSGSGESGVYLYTNSDGNVINGNTLKNSVNGVYLRNALNTTVESNTMTECGSYGALIRSSKNIDFKSNTISDTKSYPIRINYGSTDVRVLDNKLSAEKGECIHVNHSNDADPSVEKYTLITGNYLDTAIGTAAVSASNGNSAVQVYSNYRTDGLSPFYRFRSDGSAKYTNIVNEFKLKTLTIEQGERANLLEWSDVKNNTFYRVQRHYADDSTELRAAVADSAYSDALTGDYYADLSFYDVSGYTVTPAKYYGSVKYLGISLSVDAQTREKPEPPTEPTTSATEEPTEEMTSETAESSAEETQQPTQQATQQLTHQETTIPLATDPSE